MVSIVSSIYRVIKFHHEGKIVNIDQLSYCHKNISPPNPNISVVDNSAKDQLNVDIGLYPSLMGTLNFPTPKINMVSHMENDPSVVEVSFRTFYLLDPWTFPNPNDDTSTSMAMPLSTIEVSYKEIQEQTTKNESKPL